MDPLFMTTLRSAARPIAVVAMFPVLLVESALPVVFVLPGDTLLPAAGSAYGTGHLSEDRMGHDSTQAGLLTAAPGAAQREGNPTPGSDPQQWSRITRVASKRWSTFERRHPATAADAFAARVEDLARGLLEGCAARRNSGTTIDITDCRRPARSLATVFGSSPAVGPGAAVGPGGGGQ